jgi:hypothetical protein
MSGTLEEFQGELSALLNRHSVDSVTNTPDYLLAEFLVQQLQAYSLVTNKNIEWHAWKPGVGNG